MTALLAIVDSLADATAAAVAGATCVALEVPGEPECVSREIQDDFGGMPGVPLSLLIPDGAGENWSVAALLDLFQASAAADIRLPLNDAWRARLIDLTGRGIPCFGVLRPDIDAGPHTAAEAKRLGLRGLMVAASLRRPQHITLAMPVETLSLLASACHRQDLRVSLSGALELPDIPRLLALDPDELGFDRLLRDDEDAPISARRIKRVRDMLNAEAATARPTMRSRAEADTIFVRDWILSMSIGAYARERETVQRVRLSVEADVFRADERPTDMGNVVSYDLITDAARRLAATHVDLVETFAELIADAVLGHPRIGKVTVTVEKLDLGPGAVGCRITRTKAAP